MDRWGEHGPRPEPNHSLDPLFAAMTAAVEPEPGDGGGDWIRPCEVVAYEPPREFAWVVGDRFDGTPFARWAFLVLDHPPGCRIRQEFRHLPDGLSGLRLHAQAHPERAADLIAARQQDLRDGTSMTLQRMSVVLTASR